MFPAKAKTLSEEGEEEIVQGGEGITGEKKKHVA